MPRVLRAPLPPGQRSGRGSRSSSALSAVLLGKPAFCIATGRSRGCRSSGAGCQSGGHAAAERFPSPAARQGRRSHPSAAGELSGTWALQTRRAGEGLPRLRFPRRERGERPSEAGAELLWRQSFCSAFNSFRAASSAWSRAKAQRRRHSGGCSRVALAVGHRTSHLQARS